MTLEGAWAAIAALVGGGGITSIAVAYLGYKTEAAKGRKVTDGEAPAIAVGGAMAAKNDMVALTNAITTLTLVASKAAEMMERMIATQEAREREHSAEEMAELRLMAKLFREQNPGVTLTPRPGHRDPRR